MSRRKPHNVNLFQLWKFFTQGSGSAKTAFENYHLVRRKYVVSRAADAFNRNKLEPAPLLNLNLLDIGCGTSKLAEELTFRGADVTAIDLSNDCIENAQKQAEQHGAIVNFIQCTPQQLVEQGQKYHIILCMDIFEYVDHTHGFIKELPHLLHEDGIVLFSTNNRNFRSAFVHILCAQWLFKWVPKGTYKFKRFRTPKTLIGKFEDNGFEITDLCGAYLDPKENRWKRCEKPASRYLGSAVYKGVKPTKK
tara:strand:+ start:31382 stop:32131 length:750 start_codon:yes stop_codon:yes gene_type:complete